MLFDLRSRRRRRVVQVVYIGLAVLIGSGLVLFGVGTGSSGGGLFGAFTGSGSSSGSSSEITKQVAKATKETKAHPNSPAAWAALVTARYSAANTQGYDSSTETYTAKGKAQLTDVGDAYAKYTSLTSKVNADLATLAANAYGETEQFSAASNTWQSILKVSPNDSKALECTAIVSNAAGDTRVAMLAEDKLESKLSKTEAKEIKEEIAEAKKKKSYAAEAC